MIKDNSLHPDLYLYWLYLESSDGLGKYPESTFWSEHDFTNYVREIDTKELQQDTRALLRWGGFKPSGRNKPACEYLVKAALTKGLPKINLGVDLLNWVSYLYQVPISLIDLDRVESPLQVKVIEEKTNFVFNQSGQTLELQGLLNACDAQGACANAVKDSMRSKTTPETRRTLAVLWGHKKWSDWIDRAGETYEKLALEHDFKVEKGTS